MVVGKLKNEVPQILLQARPVLRHPGYEQFERIPRQRRNREVYSAPDEMQVAELRGRA